MATQDLKDRAILVKYTERCWIGGMHDREVSNEIEDSKGAKRGTGRYWKRLIPRAALKAVLAVFNEARTFHTSMTLPWMGGGVRILPAANANEYLTGMRQRREKMFNELNKFLKQYDSWIAEAERTQVKLFRRTDYPSVDQVKDKFGFEVDVTPLPSIADWRVDLSAEQAAEVRAQAEATLAKAHQEGVTEMFTRLNEVLQHAQEKLSDDEAVFRDSLVGNIKDMVALLAKLNVTGNAELEAVRKETEEKLASLKPADLREDKQARRVAATAASAIMSKMSAFMGGVKVVPQQPAAEAVQEAAAEAKPARSSLKDKTPEERRAHKTALKRAERARKGKPAPAAPVQNGPKSFKEMIKGLRGQ
jgi:hypothetical protein